MQVSETLLTIIRNFEGERLDPYQDSAGLWTIGVGHLIGEDEFFTSITHEQAMDMLRSDLQKTCDDVTQCVKVPLNENQFSALASFAYNVGVGALRNSTLLKKLNSGDYAGAAQEFVRWNRAGGKVIPGLTNRREAEQSLFEA